MTFSEEELKMLEKRWNNCTKPTRFLDRFNPSKRIIFSLGDCTSFRFRPEGFFVRVESREYGGAVAVVEYEEPPASPETLYAAVRHAPGTALRNAARLHRRVRGASRGSPKVTNRDYER